MKILVIGPYDAGKSTFISALTKGSSVSIDKHGTTVAMDHGTLDIEGLRISVFGTPGMDRFKLTREVLSKGADGVILVVDSVNREKDEEINVIYKELTENLPGIPILVAANKQDMPQARPVSALRSDVPVLEQLPIIPTSAENGTNILVCIRALMAMFFVQFDRVFKTLIQYDKSANNVESCVAMLHWSPEDRSKNLRWLENRHFISLDKEHAQYTLHERLPALIQKIPMAFKADMALIIPPN